MAGNCRVCVLNSSGMEDANTDADADADTEMYVYLISNI